MYLGAVLVTILFAGVVKLLVMIFTARLLIRLYRLPDRSSPWGVLSFLIRGGTSKSRPAAGQTPWSRPLELDLVHLSLVLFAVSELACGVEVYVLQQSAVSLAVIHGVFSAAGLALFLPAIYLYADRTALHFMTGSETCAGMHVCGECTLLTGQGCRFKGTVAWLGVLLVVLALPALFISAASRMTDPATLALPFPAVNQWYDHTVLPFLSTQFPSISQSPVPFSIPSGQLILEYRALPLLAIAVALLGVVRLLRLREAQGLLTILVAAGILSYVYLQVMAYTLLGDPLLGLLGHEVVELVFLITLGIFLKNARVLPTARPSAP